MSCVMQYVLPTDLGGQFGDLRRPRFSLPRYPCGLQRGGGRLPPRLRAPVQNVGTLRHDHLARCCTRQWRRGIARASGESKDGGGGQQKYNRCEQEGGQEAEWERVSEKTRGGRSETPLLLDYHQVVPKPLNYGFHKVETKIHS